MTRLTVLKPMLATESRMLYQNLSARCVGRNLVLTRLTLVATTMTALLFLNSKPSRAQIPETAGQSVVPVYEGWEQNPDGSYEMYFGYMNRNYTEELNIPVGPNNDMEPGGPDRGQPGYFYPRRGMFVFTVHVPKDWGNKDLTWTIIANGTTERAHGTLLPVWEIDRRLIVKNMGGTNRLDLVDKNQPPALKLDPVESIMMPSAATLIASVADDGFPPPAPRRSPRPESPEQAIANAPLPARPRPPQGLSVKWFEYRGPGRVQFSPDGYQSVTNGGSVTAHATFSQPGTYVLRAVASDSMMETSENVTVTVVASNSR